MGAGVSSSNTNTKNPPDKTNLLQHLDLDLYNVVTLKEYGVPVVSTLSGDGKCHPLPGASRRLLNKAGIPQKNVFVTKDKNIRLYKDSDCDIRANEEVYATTGFPRELLQWPWLANDPKFAKTTVTMVEYNSIANANYYKINNTVINTPKLPQFVNNQNREFPSEKAIKNCLPLPSSTIPRDNFLPTPVPNGIGIIRRASVADPPSDITIYTHKDKLQNCKNIYTPAVGKKGQLVTPIPYTTIHGYGTRIADKTNALFYQLKPEKGILD